MTSKTFLSICLILGVFCAFSEGLYFHIGETERKCFIEEIPDETMVTGEEKLFPAFVLKSKFVSNRRQHSIYGLKMFIPYNSWTHIGS